jgi:hypothetical protein
MDGVIGRYGGSCSSTQSLIFCFLEHNENIGAIDVKKFSA